MSRLNWVLCAALAAVALTTATTGWLTWPAVPTLTDYGETNPKNSQYAAGGKSCQPQALSSVRDPIQRFRQADICAKEAEDHRQNTSDLIQQTRSADAAEAQAQIASQQLWTIWLQTLGGFLTLAAAVGAAIYARDAARHTRDANEIALDATRAWLKIENISLGALPIIGEGADRHVMAMLRVTVVNHGSSPAVDVVVCASGFFERVTILSRLPEVADDVRKALAKRSAYPPTVVFPREPREISTQTDPVKDKALNIGVPLISNGVSAYFGYVVVFYKLSSGRRGWSASPFTIVSAKLSEGRRNPDLLHHSFRIDDATLNRITAGDIAL